MVKTETSQALLGAAYNLPMTISISLANGAGGLWRILPNENGILVGMLVLLSVYVRSRTLHGISPPAHYPVEVTGTAFSRTVRASEVQRKEIKMDPVIVLLGI